MQSEKGFFLETSLTPNVTLPTKSASKVLTIIYSSLQNIRRVIIFLRERKASISYVHK